jgi:hypothetical protein
MEVFERERGDDSSGDSVTFTPGCGVKLPGETLAAEAG